MFVITDHKLLDEAESALKRHDLPSPERKARIKAIQVVRATGRPAKVKHP